MTTGHCYTIVILTSSSLRVSLPLTDRGQSALEPVSSLTDDQEFFRNSLRLNQTSRVMKRTEDMERHPVAFDWLKSLRLSVSLPVVSLPAVSPRRRKSWRLATPAPLESRTLLSNVPIGSEVQVNTYTSENQGGSSIAMDADGDYVITWNSSGQDGSSTGVYAQRYNSLHVAQGSEFQVNTWTTGSESSAAIAMDNDGNFVITWHSELQDGSGYGIYAQRFNAVGVPQGSEFRVNTWITNHQKSPAIAMDDDGDFVITWTNSGQNGSNVGIYAQRYNALGVPQGTEFLVSTYTYEVGSPSIAMDADGDFVIAWQNFGQDGQYNGVYAQRFDAAGMPQGAEFKVNTWTSYDQRFSAIAMDADGNFVVTWQSNVQDGGGYGIYAQRYNATGVPQGTEFRVNTWITQSQLAPAIAMEADGDFIITWQSKSQDGSGYGIYAQRYNASGTPQGTEFRVSTRTTNDQSSPSVGMDANGNFVIAWSSNLQDGSGYGIFANGLNYTPTDIQLSNNTLSEYSTPGTTIGIFSSTDANTADYFFYTLVAGAGDTDNGAFSIVGNQLRNSVVFDYETQETYSIRVRTTDLGGLWFEKNFTINVTDVSEIGGIPIGSESLLTYGSTSAPAPYGRVLNQSIAIDADGDYVVTWQGTGKGSGWGYDIYAQRYNAAGASLGSVFRVNTTTYGQDKSPAIAMKANGDFIITWEVSLDSYNNSRSGIFAQRFNGLGEPQGPEFLVNTTTTRAVSHSSIAIDSDGDFVIAWKSLLQDGSGSGVYAQRYDALGVPLGSEFLVNTRTTGDQRSPSIGMDADGDFVITWQSNSQDGSGYGIYAQSYNASGVPQGTEFRVNTWTIGNQESPVIGMDAEGGFVITWQSYWQDGSYYGIYAQRFNRFGETLGSEFVVNTWTSEQQINPAIAMNAAGDFVISWESYPQDGSYFGVYAQVFSSHGVPQGSEFRVNSSTYLDQVNPSLGMNADGEIVITWSYSGSGYTGIYGQRYLFLDASSPNHAPLLDNAGAPFLTPILQNGSLASNTGTPISYLIARMGPSGSMTDPDSDPLGIAINGISNANGSWEYTTNYGANWLPITVTGNSDALLLSSDPLTRIRFIPNADFIGQSLLAFVAWDQTSGNNGATANVSNRGGSTPYSLTYEYATINVNNAAPVLNTSGNPALDAIPLNVNDAENPGTLVSDIIARMGPAGGITDPNPGALQGIAVNGVANTYGSWQYTINGGTNWSPITVTGNTNALLLAADPNTRIRFIPNANFIGQALLAFAAWDQTAGANGGTVDVTIRGGMTPFSSAYDFASINVNNAAPVLDNSGTPTLDSIPMNVYGINNPGTLVSEIIARMGPTGGISDPDSHPLGIAINSLSNTSNGDWQYTTNGGASWHSFGITGNSKARLLAADSQTRIRYVPKVGFQGTPTFTFFAWDQTSGGNGGAANVNSRGGTTPYSIDLESASISILNDAPVLNDAGSPAFDAILPDIPDAINQGILVSTLISRMSPAGGITDANPNSLQGIAIIGKEGTGIWEFSTNNGANWSPLNSTSAADATLLASNAKTRIRYRPISNFVSEAKITFLAWDQTTGTNGSVADATTTGGSTAFSTVSEYASIRINNAPTLNDAGTPTLNAIPLNVSDANNPGTLISDIIARMGPSGGITDPNPGALLGIAINGLGNTTTGNWQYTTDGGASWYSIGTTGNSNSRLLAADPNTRIRYVPQIDYHGTAIFSFVAWDQSAGTNGAVANVASRGGATPFSTVYEYATILVNTAPTLNNSGTPTLDSISTTMPIGSNLGILVSDLLSRMGPSGGITDPDPGALRGLAIIGQNGAATGFWQYSTNAGFSWTTVTTTGSNNALLLASDAGTRIRYVPYGGFTGTVAIAFVAWDRSQGLNGSTVNTGLRGGTSPFSIDYDLATISVTA